MSSSPPPNRKTSSTGSSGGGRFVAPTVEELDGVLSNYELVEIIGQGGMGAVYKACQPGLDRLVAIKVLPAALEEPDEMQFVERFKREAKVMAKLNHSNIVSVYDFGVTTEAQFYIVMEFVEGVDMRKLIRAGEVTQGRVIKWGLQICEALQYAHSKDLIHRDIKPGNILIDADGVVKVVDFGLAKFTGESKQTKLTNTNATMGSPDYFAPECLNDDVEIDWRADLYSLGVLIYEMLTGTVPRGAWRPPSIINPDIDDRFDDLVVQAMDPNPATRIQSAEEVAAQLKTIRDHPAPGDTGRKINLLTGPIPIKKISRQTTAIAPGSGVRPKARLVTGPIQPRAVSASADSSETAQQFFTKISAVVVPKPKQKATGPLLVFLFVSGLAAMISIILFYSFRH